MYKTMTINLKSVVLIFIFLSLFKSHSIIAQGNNENVIDSTSLKSNPESIDLLNVKLPPLQIFLDAAINAPSVEMYRSSKREQEERMNLIKNEWLNYIRGVANYSYGSMGSMTEASSTGQSTYFQYYGETMSLYNVGASITLPLDLFFNRKHKINIQKDLIEQANFRLLLALEERRAIIIENYSIAVQNLDLLRVSLDAVSLAHSTVDLGELEYINGKISLAVLNNLNRELTVAMLTNQEAKTALTIALQKQELLTNVKIIK